MANTKAAVIAAAVVLSTVTACASRQHAQGAGSLGTMSPAPSAAPQVSQSPSSGGPTVMPSHGGGGNGGGGHGGSSPKPDPASDSPPNPDPVPAPPVDYSVAFGGVSTQFPGPACSWTTLGPGVELYDLHITATYTGPQPGPTMTFTVTDGIGDVLQPIDSQDNNITGKVDTSGNLTDVIVRDTHPHPDTYSEVIIVTLAGVPSTDPNSKNNTATLDMPSIPLKNPPKDFMNGQFEAIQCAVPTS